MQKNTLIIGTILLVVGLAIGYAIGAANTPSLSQDVREETHMMPDGSMMGDSGTSMADTMAGMNAELAGKTGDAFDQAFISEMILHHQGAVEMAQLALTNAKHQEIKDLAAAIIAAQNKEIADMKAWQQAWYGGD
jgi:uncharacterized protein (DUF305 family)